jgi:phage terminase Nu1 subunit (DNA packaging protein)
MVDAVRNTQLAGVGQPVGDKKPREKLADDNADVQTLKTALKSGKDVEKKFFTPAQEKLFLERLVKDGIRLSQEQQKRFDEICKS